MDGRAGVLRGDDLGVAERLDEPARRVPEIADRRRREDDHPPILAVSAK